jgi:hypothetical protein
MIPVPLRESRLCSPCFGFDVDRRSSRSPDNFLELGFTSGFRQGDLAR